MRGKVKVRLRGCVTPGPDDLRDSNQQWRVGRGRPPPPHGPMRSTLHTGAGKAVGSICEAGGGRG